ncbi:MAG TPA: N-acetyl-gamma-glutamyl-phosphate reductase [Acidimicrobiales bacterium]|nr:N-acetyl-gamma-glutamyl-phosphate reductase [Acidimicrobiales bacterium]
MSAKLKVGVFGASGYAGAELLRLAAGHPAMDVVLATADTQAGGRVADLYPSLASAYRSLVFTASDKSEADGLDLVFLAMPHGASQDLVPDLLERNGTVVDLAADFRLSDTSLYPVWYGEEHHHPELLEQAVYGIPELFKEALPGARLIAAPGCYPTAAALALAPLARAGAIEATGVVVDAASGVSGAGRAPKPSTHFNTVDEDFTAYGLLTHRHTPEIEQAAGVEVLFTPHLAPMNRGILATCYARPASSGTAAPDPLRVLEDFYAGEPFVVVDERLPSTKATLGSNCAHITARTDSRTGWIVVISAIDNLTKGAAGQAIQCANIALGLEQTTGLPLVGLYP